MPQVATLLLEAITSKQPLNEEEVKKYRVRSFSINFCIYILVKKYKKIIF